MSRRLNQEAAKTIKYGGMSELDAWNTVTINPAQLLHLDDRAGSIRLERMPMLSYGAIILCRFMLKQKKQSLRVVYFSI